jgi:hypothetical protein
MEHVVSELLGLPFRLSVNVPAGPVQGGENVVEKGQDDLHGCAWNRNRVKVRTAIDC